MKNPHLKQLRIANQKQDKVQHRQSKQRRVTPKEIEKQYWNNSIKHKTKEKPHNTNLLNTANNHEQASSKHTHLYWGLPKAKNWATNRYKLKTDPQTNDTARWTQPTRLNPLGSIISFTPHMERTRHDKKVDLTKNEPRTDHNSIKPQSHRRWREAMSTTIIVEAHKPTDTWLQ